MLNCLASIFDWTVFLLWTLLLTYSRFGLWPFDMVACFYICLETGFAATAAGLASYFIGADAFGLGLLSALLCPSAFPCGFSEVDVFFGAPMAFDFAGAASSFFFCIFWGSTSIIFFVPRLPAPCASAAPPSFSLCSDVPWLAQSWAASVSAILC